jgi:hypothetical protein
LVDQRKTNEEFELDSCCVKKAKKARARKFILKIGQTPGCHAPQGSSASELGHFIISLEQVDLTDNFAFLMNE